MLSRRIVSTYKKAAPPPSGDITYLGQDVLTNVSDPASGSVTVNASADAIIVFATGYRFEKQSLVMFDELNFDNGGAQDFLHIGTTRRTDSDSPTAGMFIMPASSSAWPGAGAKTIYRRGPVDDVDYTRGVTMVVSYWSGVAQTDPIRTTEIRNLHDVQAIEESSMVGVQPTDMSIGVATVFDQIPDAAPAGYGQTAIEESIFNRWGTGVHYELGEDVLRFENLKTSDGGVVWAAIKAA